MSLAGRRALVTGGTRGIGLATARALAAEGARVAVSWSRSADDAAAALTALSAQGATAHAVRADVGDPAAVRRMFAEVGDALGGSPDVLINNAAITEDGLLMMLADEAWERVIRTDLSGAALCCRLALRAMIAGRWGRIVNVVSPAAFLGQEGASNRCRRASSRRSCSPPCRRRAGRRWSDRSPSDGRARRRRSPPRSSSSSRRPRPTSPARRFTWTAASRCSKRLGRWIATVSAAK